MHKRLILSFVLMFMMTLVIHAQDHRDYVILDTSYQVSEDQSQIILDITVQNQGAGTTSNAELVVRVDGNPELELERLVIEPLAGSEIRMLSVTLPIALFSTESARMVEVAVGLDAFELPDTPIAEDNVTQVEILLDVVNDLTTFEIRGEEFIVFNYVFTRQDIAIYLVSFVMVTIFVWLITVLFRFLFGKSPHLGAWQPPYALLPMYDQNTIEGRRQAWQSLAQNNLLLAPPSEGNLHPVKMLMGGDGGNLHNWKITGMRLSQYDTYGRIARTQAIAPKRWVNRLTKVLNRREGKSEEKLQNMLRPIACGVVNQFKKKVKKKSAFLPIALDIRFEGKHGEVRIVFELYQFQGQAWYRLDQWEPTMMVMTQKLQENFTFTIHGCLTDEKMNDFFDRLRDDLIWLLLEMARLEEPVIAKHELPPEGQREAVDIPDTLSDMEPIGDDSQPYPSHA